MTNQIYKKVGRRYKPVGIEWTGWPVDGLWLVQNGQQCQIIRLSDIGSLPPVHAIPYAVMAEEAVKYVVNNIKRPWSIYDVVHLTAQFFAREAEEVEISNEKSTGRSINDLHKGIRHAYF